MYSTTAQGREGRTTGAKVRPVDGRSRRGGGHGERTEAERHSLDVGPVGAPPPLLHRPALVLAYSGLGDQGLLDISGVAATGVAIAVAMATVADAVLMADVVVVVVCLLASPLTCAPRYWHFSRETCNAHCTRRQDGSRQGRRPIEPSRTSCPSSRLFCTHIQTDRAAVP